MAKISDLKFLRSIKTGKGLLKLIKSLRAERRATKVKDVKRSVLSKHQRQLVFDKTNGRCHICGIELQLSNFHADHVKSHISGGLHAENNYLPGCSTCNNLRWHYSPEEIQIIMKMGRWLKTKLLDESEESLSLANQFVRHEMALRKRRKIKI
jgi:hypothetical protein